MSQKQKTEKDLLSEISEKLDVLVAINAANLTALKDLSVARKVQLLSLAGFTQKEIGSLLSMTDRNVRNILAKIKKESE